MPKVFISYSWEDDEHKNWVKSFTDQLLECGIDATLDQYDLTLGDRLPQFMEQSITNSDYVLIICTPTYKEKSDSRKGGVGYEGHIISGELFSIGNERKYIPVIRKGNASSALPSCLSSKLGIDLSKESDYQQNFMDLVTTIWGGKKKPMVRKKPSYVAENVQRIGEENEPCHILGIITDEVTIPKMDGSRGSALYAIPFRLSKSPSNLWKDLFIRAWNFPPSFSTMHRPGIAQVYGDKIVLDGTTIEEVKKYHRDTLILCVDLANKQETELIEKKRIKQELEKKRKENHFNNVNSIAEEIFF